MAFNSSAHGDSSANLREFLAEEARRASDGQLTLAATVGVLVVAVALMWHPPGGSYFLASGLTCSAFGLWGISDRLLAEQGGSLSRRTTFLRVVRVASALVGALAGGGLLLLVLFIGLGTWIS